MSIEKDVELIYEIGTMRHISRMWTQFGGLNVANLAEHTLRVMWIATVIAKHENADLGKVLQLSLVHDLGETRAGDVSYLSRMYVKRDEATAVEHSISETEIENEIFEWWSEYEERHSLESKIVKDADNLDCDFELKELLHTGAKLPVSLAETRSSVYERLFTGTAKRIFKAIENSNPDDWHAKGVNRLTAGDWKK